MNSYELSRKWFDFSFENPHKVKPIHSSIYFFAIEHCNRLGWKSIFGFPTSMVLEAIGMKSYSSYKKHFDELVDFGFIKVHEYSKNQYSANIIELSLNVKALDKALDKAFVKHNAKQVKSTVSIDKQINKETIELINNNIILINDNLEGWINKELNSNTDLVEIKQEFLNSTTWIQQISMKKKITEGACIDYLKTFLDDLELKEELDRPINEVRKHFVNWLNLELKKPKEKQTFSEKVLGKDRHAKVLEQLRQNDIDKLKLEG